MKFIDRKLFFSKDSKMCIKNEYKKRIIIIIRTKINEIKLFICVIDDHLILLFLISQKKQLLKAFEKSKQNDPFCNKINYKRH
jgi:hypothetical protein